MNLGKYELLEQLGKGGFGTVYRSKDTSLDREVAVKILHPQLMVDEAFIERFRKEAKTLAKLEHPNIVPIYDLGEEDGRLYITMRLLSGGSLRDVIKKEGHLSWAETLKIVQQVGDALQVAHTQEGLIHRDIKPENILFDKQGNAVLSDFGLVRAASGSLSSSTANAVMGTPNYIAPEIWNGEGASPASDQYALACVVAEMLTGKQVFNGDTTPVIMKKHILDQPGIPLVWSEDVPAVVSVALRIALAKENTKRYKDIQQFIQALSNTLEAMPSMKPQKELQTIEKSQESVHQLPTLKPIDQSTPPVSLKAKKQNELGITPLLSESQTKIAQKVNRNTLAVGSFITSLVAPLGYFTIAPIAIYFGYVALTQLRHNSLKGNGKNLAVIGLIFGSIETIIGLVIYMKNLGFF